MALHWRLVGEERLRHAKAKMQARQQAALTAVLARYQKVHTADCTAWRLTALQHEGEWPSVHVQSIWWGTTDSHVRVASVLRHTTGQDAPRAGRCDCSGSDGQRRCRRQASKSEASEVLHLA
jgi:hypothetical protein